MNAIMHPGGGAAELSVPMPVWPQVEAVEPARIGAFLSAEHAQTGAYVLSRLAPATAAATLLTLDKRLRGDLVKRLVALTGVPEAAERIIERQLRERLLSESVSRDTSAGQLRVAGLLNEMDKDALEEVMRDLEEAGAPDLEAIRARLFSFEDIPLLTQKARVALFDGLPTELVTLALRNCPGAFGEAVLSSIGARSRRMIESELAQGIDVPAADIARARKTIASAAIRMAGQGAFDLPSAQQAAA
jgi:flagellar motor switch protein FliG